MSRSLAVVDPVLTALTRRSMLWHGELPYITGAQMRAMREEVEPYVSQDPEHVAARAAAFLPPVVTVYGVEYVLNPLSGRWERA